MPKYTAASPDEPAPAQAGADQWRTCVLCALGLMLLVAASGLSWFADEPTTITFYLYRAQSGAAATSHRPSAGGSANSI